MATDAFSNNSFEGICPDDIALDWNLRSIVLKEYQFMVSILSFDILFSLYVLLNAADYDHSKFHEGSKETNIYRFVALHCFNQRILNRQMNIEEMERYNLIF